MDLGNFSIKFTQISTLTAPLRMLMKNNASFVWVKKYIEVLNILELSYF
jgi:hypothetical protein